MTYAFKGFVVRYGVPVLAFVFVAGLALAADPVSTGDATSSGKMSVELSRGLYCSTKDVLQGDIGLMIGLALVFMGIWSMVQGAKMMASVPFIVMGALITALPSIAEASLAGLANLLVAAEISDKETSKTFVNVDCTFKNSSSTDEHKGKTEDDYINPQSTLLSPGLSVIKANYVPKTPETCPPGAGSSVCQ